MSEINRENGGEEHAAVELAATEPEEVEPEAERILRITLTCWHVFVRENFVSVDMDLTYLIQFN